MPSDWTARTFIASRSKTARTSPTSIPRTQVLRGRLFLADHPAQCLALHGRRHLHSRFGKRAASKPTTCRRRSLWSSRPPTAPRLAGHDPASRRRPDDGQRQGPADREPLWRTRRADRCAMPGWAGDLFDQILARQGFAVLHVDNRGMANRGKAFALPIKHHFGPD